jgi:DNA-binding NtrC family response regulator
MKMLVTGLPPESLPDSVHRERAWRRRLAAVALSVLCRPAPAEELLAALGCELRQAFDGAYERRQARWGTGELLEPALPFDVGAFLLGFEEARQAMLKLLPLARDSFQASLLADPVGEALRRAWSLPPDSSFQPLVRVLAALPGQPAELAPLALAALGDPKLALARERAAEAWSRLTSGFSSDQVPCFRRSQEPRLLARLGLRQEETPPGLPYLRGASAPFAALVEQLRRVAPSRASVLLLGETGVGKELCARAIHDLSDRRVGPFIPLNCAAVTDELFLSELFGHEKGAFTGAVQRRVGRFEQADGGTLFLDEIADMSPRGQAALLRALQERTFERVGGTTVLRADVRLVAASNRDLSEAVTAGEFRKDLYFRLCGIRIFVPPLRARDDDALLLAARFLEESAADRQGPARAFSPEAERRIRTYPWPGNIRELRNAVQAADLLCEGQVISADLLGSLLQREAPTARATRTTEERFEAFRAEGVTLKKYLLRIQTEFIARALELNTGNVAAAAAELGFSRSRLSQIVYATEELRRRASGERRAARRRKRP